MEIEKILNVALPIFLVWPEFDKLMFSWFITDCHPMTWERVLVVRLQYRTYMYVGLDISSN